MKPTVRLLVILLALCPVAAYAQGAPLTYGERIPSRVQGWYAPVASNLIGSDEQDHLRRGSVNAWDWSAALGSPVFAIGPGVVSYAGCNDQGHYGCWVQIDHGSGYTSASAHCMEGSIRVQQGQRVDAATQICNIGRTGWTDWPHVHLVIKKDGAHQKLSNFFDSRLVHYCFWTKCQATNSPSAPVTFGSGGGWVAQTTRAVTDSFDGRLAMTVFVVCGLLFLAANRTGRYVLFFAVTIYAAIVTAMPPAPAMTAQAMVSSGLAGWEQVYPILQNNEGWSCTEDGAHTMGGVTQGAYDAWRTSKGVGYADVCVGLTRAQAKQLYYERYWLASGADRLPLALALTHVDHAINAGVGAARRILAQCGNNVACYNQGRVADYYSKSNCARYCVAWINRVNKIRRYTGG
jgi:hypothetical protein